MPQMTPNKVETNRIRAAIELVDIIETHAAASGLTLDDMLTVLTDTHPATQARRDDLWAVWGEARRSGYLPSGETRDAAVAALKVRIGVNARSIEDLFAGL